DVLGLDQRVVVIGQRAGCDLVIPGETVSTTHAAIYDVNGRRYIMDLGSRNGTFVNGAKTLQVELKIGDVIEIGGTDIRYTAAADAAARATATSKPSVPNYELPPPVADLVVMLALET